MLDPWSGNWDPACCAWTKNRGGGGLKLKEKKKSLQENYSEVATAAWEAHLLPFWPWSLHRQKKLKTPHSYHHQGYGEDKAAVSLIFSFIWEKSLLNFLASQNYLFQKKKGIVYNGKISMKRSKDGKNYY